MTQLTILAAVKLALRMTTTAYDDELSDLILAGRKDLAEAGIALDSDTTDPLLRRAVITYCKANFGQPDAYADLKASYDEQKAQMATCTGYTTWTTGVADNG